MAVFNQPPFGQKKHAARTQPAGSFPGPAPGPAPAVNTAPFDNDDSTPEPMNAMPSQFNSGGNVVRPPREFSNSIYATAANWLFGQPANTVALYLILMAIVYGAWYLITIGIPLHLKQIQAGYETISVKDAEIHREIRELHKDELTKSRELQREEFSKLQQTFEKAIDRHEKSFLEGFRAAKGEK